MIINDVGLCRVCNSPTKFLGVNKGYSKHCSYKCSNSNKETQNKKKESYLNKYGVDNPSKSNEIKQKKRETNIKTCGVDCNLKLESVKDAIKKTCKIKYGVDYYLQSDEYKHKIWERNYNRIKNNKFINISPMFMLEEYRGVELTYKFKCTVCQSIFDDHLQDGRIPICRVCFPIKQSKAQLELYDYIKIYYGDTLLSTRNIIDEMELDIYIPSKKIAIEYNGIYYHSEISGNRNKTYHINKTEKCEANNITLIQIFEDEFLFNKELVYGKINRLLNIKTNINRVYARNCLIKVVEPSIANEFLISNYIQGNDHSLIRLGAFYNEKLVALMTFGKTRVSMGGCAQKNVYELYRYCSNCSVVGGASKIFTHFIRLYNPDKIITYADRRWSTGNLYEKMGLTLISKTKPNYWYTKDHVKRFHRFGFRKNVLKKRLVNFDNSLTEWQNMQLNGYDRIWDCGSLKYEWKKK